MFKVLRILAWFNMQGFTLSDNNKSEKKVKKDNVSMQFPFLTYVILCVVAISVWSPLVGLSISSINVYYFEFNWIALILSVGVGYFVQDFGDFQRFAKFRYYILAILMCPLWIIVRNLKFFQELRK